MIIYVGVYPISLFYWIILIFHLPSQVLFNLNNVSFQIINKVQFFAVTVAKLRFAQFTLVTGFAIYFNNIYVVVLLIVFTFLALNVYLLWLLSNHGQTREFSKNKLNPALIKTCFQVNLGSIAAVVMTHFSVIYIGNNLSYEKLGIFDVLWQLQAILVVFGSALVPYLNARWLHGSRVVFRRTIMKLLSILIFSFFAFYLLLYFRSSSLVILVYGWEFVEAAPLLPYMFLIALCQFVTVIVGPFWFMEGNQKFVVIMSILMAMVTIFAIQIIKPDSIIEIMDINFYIQLSIAIVNVLYMGILVKSA